MIKEFFIPVPDVPYGKTTNEGKGYQAMYNGPRYLLLRIASDENHRVWCVDVSSDDADGVAQLESMKKTNLVDHYQIILDAETHTWEAAWLTNTYSHGDIPNYEETLPNGDIFVYDYPDETGVLSRIHDGFLYYDKGSQTYMRPPFANYHLSESEFHENLDRKIKQISKIKQKNENKFDDALIEEINEWLAWAGSAKEMSKTVPHWKINFKRDPDIYQYAED